MFKKLLSTGGLSFDRLVNFCAIAEQGSITKAAGGDPAKQSLYSRQIRELEEFFGVELTRRKGKGIEITEAGNELVRNARLQLQGLEDFKSSCEGAPLDFRIASGNSVLEWFLIPRLKTFQKELKPYSLHFHEFRSREIVQGLVDHSIDFGIVRKTALVSSLKSAPMVELGYSLFAPVAWKKEKVEDLLNHHPLATPIGGEFLEQFQSAAQKHKQTIRITHFCSSFTQAAQLVRHGIASAILPDLVMHGIDPLIPRHKLTWITGYRRELLLAWHPRLISIRPRALKLLEVFKGMKKY